METLKIKNRKNQNIAVVIEKSDPQKGLVFIMHGLGGFKEQDEIKTLAETFKEKGFTVVRFDTTNTFGESDGKYEDATLTGYYNDLEDVIDWAKKRNWYQHPFALVGSSLGGISTILYAERHPKDIFALAPISPVVSGKLSMETQKKYHAESFANWEKSGWRETKSISKPGVIKRLPFSAVEDWLQYDTIPNAKNLTMPVLIIVGEDDTSTPPEVVKILYDAVPGPKKMEVIKKCTAHFPGSRTIEKDTRCSFGVDRFAKFIAAPLALPLSVQKHVHCVLH
jgi:uncharacterized protein